MNVIKRLKKRIRYLLRRRFDSKNRDRLLNKDISILSSNCIGGIIYNSLGLRFLSPTINMFFSASDYIKFLQKPEDYLSAKLVEVECRDVDYPVAKCEDIYLNCVHYKTFDEFNSKWTIRKERIVWDNIFVIMVERDGCTLDDIYAFDALPYKNKVIFVRKEMPEVKSAYYIPGTETFGDEQNGVRSLTDYLPGITGIRYIDLFDYVQFFNSGKL